MKYMHSRFTAPCPDILFAVMNDICEGQHGGELRHTTARWWLYVYRPVYVALVREPQPQTSSALYSLPQRVALRKPFIPTPIMYSVIRVHLRLARDQIHSHTHTTPS